MKTEEKEKDNAETQRTQRFAERKAAQREICES